MDRTAPRSRRPLAVTADTDLLEELLRVAATAAVELEVAADLGAAAASWASAPFVVVGDDAALRRRGRRSLPRRDDVVLVGSDLDDAGVWQRAVQVGAEHVVFLPDAEVWLVERLGEAVDRPAGPLAPLVAVVGGRGGAGATTLASALALSAARAGSRTLLVDGDPLGGGIDLVFGGEGHRGLRWPDLQATRGRLAASTLADGLPRLSDSAGLSVLSWDRGDAPAVPVEAVQAVLGAARRGHDLVVVDLPRTVDDAARLVLGEASTTLLVVPAEVRAAAAASRVASAVGLLTRDLRVVVRGPSPGGLGAAAVARVLGLPLAGSVAAEDDLDTDLERGRPPARKGKGPLARLCDQLLGELVPPLEQAA